MCQPLLHMFTFIKNQFFKEWVCLLFFVVNVDEWLNQAHMDSLTAEENGMARTSSQISLHTESSGGVCVFHSGVCEWERFRIQWLRVKKLWNIYIKDLVFFFIIITIRFKPFFDLCYFHSLICDTVYPHDDLALDVVIAEVNQFD